MALETVGLLRAWKYWTDSSGQNFVKLTGLDGNEILNRRIIVHEVGSSPFRKTDHADDICRSIVRRRVSRGYPDGSSVYGISQRTCPSRPMPTRASA